MKRGPKNLTRLQSLNTVPTGCLLNLMIGRQVFRMRTGNPRFNAVRFGSQKIGLKRSVHIPNFQNGLRREFPTASSGYVDPQGKSGEYFQKLRGIFLATSGRLPDGPAKVFSEPFQSLKSGVDSGCVAQPVAHRSQSLSRSASRSAQSLIPGFPPGSLETPVFPAHFFVKMSIF